MTPITRKNRRPTRAAALSAATAALLAAALVGGAAHGQTVGDYENALTAAAQGGAAATACPPLVNYAFVAMSPGELVCPSPIVGLMRAGFGGTGDADPAAAARAACLAQMTQPVITFDGGLGEDIVAQPAMEDPTKPVGEQRPVY